MPLWPPPPVPAFIAGYAPLPATLGDGSSLTSWVQASLGFCTQRIAFRGRQTVTQNITSANAFFTLALDTVDEDPFGPYGTTGYGWRSSSNAWYAPFTGWYEVTVTGTAQAGNQWLGAGVQVTGGTTFQDEEVAVTAANFGGASASQVVPMIGGGQDYVQARIIGSVTFSTDVSTAGRVPSMEIVFLSE